MPFFIGQIRLEKQVPIEQMMFGTPRSACKKESAPVASSSHKVIYAALIGNARLALL